MKSDLARQIRATAGKVDQSHPETVAGQHLRKAATLVQSGQHDGAKRHLDAAMEIMTPRNLIRHGVTDDEGHATAKTAMHQMNVHRLGVMDIQDVEARNAQEAGAKKDAVAAQAQDRAAKLQQQAAAKAQSQQAQAAASQQATAAKTAAKPTGTGPGSQQQTGPRPDPILVTANWQPPGMALLDLSARTAALEVTPHPNGRPGGPGLYGKAGNKHSDYFEQIVHALMTKRGMDQATASKIAWGALRKWRSGGGKVHPEVRAAAAGALGQEQAAKLAASWEQAGRLIELAASAAWRHELRGPDGRFVRGAGGSRASSVQPLPDEAAWQDDTRRALLAFAQKQLQTAMTMPPQQMTAHQLEVSTRVIASLTEHKMDRINEQLAKVVTPPVAEHVKTHLQALRQELNRETQKDAKHALIFHIAMILGAVGISLAAGGLGVPVGIAAIIAISPSVAQELRDWRASQQTVGNTEKISSREVAGAA